MSKAGPAPPAWWWCALVLICLPLAMVFAVMAVIDAAGKAGSAIYWQLKRGR